MRIGIFGGTFDPPHLGHLILAAEARYQLRLDKLLFVLTPDPPHKLNRRISPVTHRLDMLQTALADEPCVENRRFKKSAISTGSEFLTSIISGLTASTSMGVSHSAIWASIFSMFSREAMTVTCLREG